jgi:hypothetical protein
MFIAFARRARPASQQAVRMPAASSTLIAVGLDVQVCRSLGIGFSDLADRWIFFSPEDIEEAGLSVKIDDHEKQLMEATDHFEKLRTDAADEEWEEYKFPHVA